VFDNEKYMGIGKFKINDFNIGFGALVLPTLLLIGILNNISTNSALFYIGCVTMYFYLKKN
jgi:hypothetical protein